MSEHGLYRGHPAWMRWIRAAAKDDEERLGFPASALDLCTSQDIRALTAVAACWEFYTVADEPGEQAALQCVRELLTAMEPSCWIFARALIDRSMDWRDRDRVWPMVVGASADDPMRRLQTKLNAHGATLNFAARSWHRRDVEGVLRWLERQVRQHLEQRAPRCEWEDCGRAPSEQRGYFRFCAKHAAEIDERDPALCDDCAAGNCGRHLKA